MLLVLLFILKISWFCEFLDIYALALLPFVHIEKNCVFVDILPFISQTSNKQFTSNVYDQIWYKRHRSHNDDTDIVINTYDLNYIIRNDKSKCLHLQIRFPIWNMIISVKRSQWVLQGLIVWKLLYSWHTVTVKLITSWCPFKKYCNAWTIYTSF